MSDLELKNKPAHSSLNPFSETKTSEHPSIATIASYSGPIPPPHFLVQYEQLVAGSAQKFLEAPYIEAEHRRALEKMEVEEKIKLKKRGQIMAFSLATLCSVGALVAIFCGHSLEGLGALVLSIGAFAGVFYYAKKHQ